MSPYKVLIVGLYHIYSKFIILLNSCSTIIQRFEWCCSFQTVFLVKKLQNIVIAGLILCNVRRVCHFHADSALLTSVMNTITEYIHFINIYFSPHNYIINIY